VGFEGAPSLSPDGLSLFWEASGVIRVAARAALDAGFEPPTTLFTGGDPWFTPGTLLYSLVGDGGVRDIYLAEQVMPGSPFMNHQPFEALNSAFDDRDPSACLDGVASVVFLASNRPGTSGAADLYWSRADENGVWLPPEPVPGVNSAAEEGNPHPSMDCSLLYFDVLVSGQYDLFVAARTDGGYGPAQPISALNTTALELSPGVSADGTTLVFSSNRSGGAGNTDLWTSQLVCP